ncbi:MAG: 2-isopropylmalate synthase [Hyphomicrobiaceae bacterium]|jgi:2-isopropylmalate synthase
MPVMPIEKYKQFTPMALPDRTWPGEVITKAPAWCSVDLRDGNQALIEPMGPERKLRMFKALCDMGFKEIEVGFPSASDTDFAFCRKIIEEGLIPDDVVIQVLTQSREELIRRTFESIEGAKSAIVHLYNSTSTTQRRVVFNLDMAGITKIAVDGAKLIKELVPSVPGTKIIHQYSPESFTQTEMPYALEICEAVMDVWQPTTDNKTIINLPATVEVSTPNIYADQIEWMHRNFSKRDCVVLSLHPHNDRGTGVAAAEFGVMAGADRIEGTLFGNGERTGNVDIITLGMNMVSQGVDAGLDMRNMRELRATAEYCNQLPVHPRHPYAGDLVFTAFSGSHQDAINKGLKAGKTANSEVWDVPYLPIDPADVGASYEAVIRINSQSGKGGISYIMETEYGIQMPRALQVEFSGVVQQISDGTGEEQTSTDIWAAFEKEYLNATAPYEFLEHVTRPGSHASEIRELTAKMRKSGQELELEGKGTGPIDAYVDAIGRDAGVDVKVFSYSEHSVGSGADATAIAFVEAEVDGRRLYGVGRSANIVSASLIAVTCAVNRVLQTAGK